MSAGEARARVWALYQRPGTPLQFEEALDDYVMALLQEHAHSLAERYGQSADPIDPPR